MSSEAAAAAAPMQQKTLEPEAWAVAGKVVEEVDVPPSALLVAPIPG